MIPYLVLDWWIRPVSPGKHRAPSPTSFQGGTTGRWAGKAGCRGILAAQSIELSVVPGVLFRNNQRRSRLKAESNLSSTAVVLV